MKIKNLNYFRIALQWLVLLLILHEIVRPFFDISYHTDVEAYCPFGGLQALSTYLITDTLACSMTTLQIFMGLGLLAVAVLFSKLFCSYICPLGTITEWFGKQGKRFKLRITLTGFIDRIFRSIKYILLFLTFYFTIYSSELFCKKFDPYFAASTGFSSDVVFLYAIIAISLLIIGSFFITQGWCKYLCPLSAITNIFSNFILFASVIAIYIFLIAFIKINISWVWILLSFIVLGYLMEAIYARLWIFPLFKVTRNPDTCTLCRKCDKVCPMAIKVSEMGRVNHIDCHLCGDCIVKCPEKGVLKINRKSLMWLPPVIIALTIILGIIFSKKVELPTINIVWGTEQQMKDAKVVSLENMKSIKCYGSSVSFAEQMKNIEGILGVKTFVKKHLVEVYYDDKLIAEEDVKKSVFIPSKIMIATPVTDSIVCINVKILNYFDAYDEYLLTELLSKQKSIFGFTTHFGEPVDVEIFCATEISPEKLKKIIESKEVLISDGNEQTTEKLEFKVESMNKTSKIISASVFLENMVPVYDLKFNKYETYKTNEIEIFETVVKNFNPNLNDQLSYLVSHVSENKFVIRVQSKYVGCKTFVNISFIKSKTSVDDIKNAIKAKEFNVTYSDGSTEKVTNELKFEF